MNLCFLLLTSYVLQLFTVNGQLIISTANGCVGGGLDGNGKCTLPPGTTAIDSGAFYNNKLIMEMVFNNDGAFKDIMSGAFSNSSLTTEAGRCTTSPAAI